MTWKNLGYQPHPWRAATQSTAATVKAKVKTSRGWGEGKGWAAQPARFPSKSMLEGSG